MAIEVRAFTVTIPAGTGVAAGFTADISFPARVVTQIRVRVPPGPRGEVGFAIGTGGIPIVPFGQGTWIVTDDEDLAFTLTDAIESGAWQLLAYNTGSFPHTLRVYFDCELLGSATTSGGLTPLPPGSLSGGGGIVITGGGGSLGSGGGSPGSGGGSPGSGGGGSSGSGGGAPGSGGGGPGSGAGGGAPGIAPPLILPPVPPPIPGIGTQTPPPVPDQVLVGVASAETVWLLAGGVYWPLATQDDVSSLLAAPMPGVPVSGAEHDGLRAAWPAGGAAESAIEASEGV